jgi:hypothetical protein
MEVYHQLGYNYNWNIDHFEKNIGDGLIFSPVNIPSNVIDEDINLEIKKSSFLDPQMYQLSEKKGTIDSYSYFLGNFKEDFSLTDFDSYSDDIAKSCVDYQLSNSFKFIVIPTIYSQSNQSKNLEEFNTYIIDPFINYIEKVSLNKKVVLTIVLRQEVLINEEELYKLLNFITSLTAIDGVYIIFENNYPDKQIKELDFLINALNVIKILKENDFEVHIGYSNTESILYSIAMPDSVTIGSYENLRSFSIQRFQTNDQGMRRSPNARVYSSKLLQWVQYEYVQSLKLNFENYLDFFDHSEYNPLTTTPADKTWKNSIKKPYLHYLKVYYEQIKSLPANQGERIDFVNKKIINALELYQEIRRIGLIFDANSDGSHLITWNNALNTFKNSL